MSKAVVLCYMKKGCIVLVQKQRYCISYGFIVLYQIWLHCIVSDTVVLLYELVLNAVASHCVKLSGIVSSLVQRPKGDPKLEITEDADLVP